jgi:putative transcriptional regulator
MKVKVPQNFADSIRGLRLAMRLTQTEFAEELGVTQVTVSRWETGYSKPSPLAWRAVKLLERSRESRHKTFNPQ